jgi:hypothetical protein
MLWSRSRKGITGTAVSGITCRFDDGMMAVLRTRMTSS